VIVKVYFKTPDAVNEALNEPVARQMQEEGLNVIDDAWDGEFENRKRAEYEKLSALGIMYGEACWLEIDTDTGDVKIVK